MPSKHPVPSYGLEHGSSSGFRSRLWFDSSELRDKAVADLAREAREQAANRELLVHKLLSYGPQTYVEAGPPAVHVRWRASAVRVAPRGVIQEVDACAVVDVLSGQVVITDTHYPALVLPEGRASLLEQYPADSRESARLNPVELRKADPLAGFDYVVVDRRDLPLLQLRLENAAPLGVRRRAAVPV